MKPIHHWQLFWRKKSLKHWKRKEIQEKETKERYNETKWRWEGKATRWSDALESKQKENLTVQQLESWINYYLYLSGSRRVRIVQWRLIERRNFTSLEHRRLATGNRWYWRALLCIIRKTAYKHVEVQRPRVRSRDWETSPTNRIQQRCLRRSTSWQQQWLRSNQWTGEQAQQCSRLLSGRQKYEQRW